MEGLSEGVPHVMDGRPSALGRTALVDGCGSIVSPGSGPPNPLALFGVIGIFTSRVVVDGAKDGTVGTGGTGSLVV